MARREGVDLKMSEIIYDLIDDVEERLFQEWGTKTETVVVGQAEVLKVFALRGKLKGTVIAGEPPVFPTRSAGIHVFWVFSVATGVRLDTGKITTGSLVRVMRSAEVVVAKDPDEDTADQNGGLMTVGRGKVATIHHHTATIDEHTEIGGECGVCLGSTFTGFEEGDIIELIEERAVVKD